MLFNEVLKLMLHARLCAHRHDHHCVGSIAVISRRGGHLVLLCGSAASAQVRELLFSRYDLNLFDLSDATRDGVANYESVGVKSLEHSWVHDDVGGSVGVDALDGDLVFRVVVLVQHNECFISEGVPQELSRRYLFNQSDISLGFGSDILSNRVYICGRSNTNKP